MKGVSIFVACIVLLFTGCAGTLTPDVASTVQVAVAATMTAQPTETPIEMPTCTPTYDIESTVQIAVAATLAAQPTKTSMPIPTETPAPTPTLNQTSTWTPPTTEMPPPFTHTLETHQGQGFSFQYPADARLETLAPRRMAWQLTLPATTEVRVHGPGAWVRQCDGNWSRYNSSYMLIIRTYENPEGLDAESWARNYLIASWTGAKERNRPRGSLPVSEDGEINENKVGSTVVAGQPAFWVSYFGFDSTRRAYYLSSDRQIVEVSFDLYLVANVPLAMVQGDVYALILSTLRLE